MDFEKSEFDELVVNDIDLKNVFDHLKSNFELVLRYQVKEY